MKHTLIIIVEGLTQGQEESMNVSTSEIISAAVQRGLSGQGIFSF